MGAILQHEGKTFVGDFCPAWFPKLFISPQNHTGISISYKADWPLRSGFLLVLVAYINPLFLYMLAMWLSTFFSGAEHILLLWWSGKEWKESTSSSPEFSCSPCIISTSCLVFPTYTSGLANQHLFKILLTDYRQFSRTTAWQLTTAYNSVSRGSDTLTQTYIHAKHECT